MKQFVFVGGYTAPGQQAIHRLVVDTETGALEALDPVPGIDNPIYFTVNKAKTRLYVAQGAVPDAPRASNGSLAVYAIGPDHGLALLDSRPTHFSVPCHISLDREEKALLYAEYSAAHAGVLGLREDGAFEPGEGVSVHHEGHGPNAARQESAHCHCAIATPDNRLMMVCDLGTDAIVAYDLADWRGGLRRAPAADIHVAPGSGPRHFVFSPEGRFAFLVNELASTVQAFAYENGVFRALQEPLSMLPADFHGETKAAAIRLCPCGHVLLASNRGHDSIAAFRVADDGTLSAPVISPLTGHFPRDFAFVPDSHLLLVGHKLSDELAVYSFDPDTLAITREAATYAMPRPLAIAFA